MLDLKRDKEQVTSFISKIVAQMAPQEHVTRIAERIVNQAKMDLK